MIFLYRPTKTNRYSIIYLLLEIKEHAQCLEYQWRIDSDHKDGCTSYVSGWSNIDPAVESPNGHSWKQISSISTDEDAASQSPPDDIQEKMSLYFRKAQEYKLALDQYKLALDLSRKLKKNGDDVQTVLASLEKLRSDLRSLRDELSPWLWPAD